MLTLLYICLMGRWNNLKPLDAEYIVGNYGKKTVQQIATDLNATTERVRRVLKMNGVEMMGKSALYSNINQLKFEYEDALCEDYKNGMSLVGILKKYSVGQEKVKMILERNNVDRKQGRGQRTLSTWASGKRKPSNCNKGGTKNIYNSLFGRWKAGAKSREYPFTVSIDNLQDILEKQDFKCAYTNIEMLCPKTFLEKREMTSSPYLVSLDRIDNDLGYIEGNVQFVCVWANKARGAYKDELFRDILKKFKEQV